MDAKIAELTFFDIIIAKKEFLLKSKIYKKEELKNIGIGELKAYDEILKDIEILNKEDFVKKYLEIIKSSSFKFEKININSAQSKEEAEMEGYNNAIVNVLSCINPAYEYYEKEL